MTTAESMIEQVLIERLSDNSYRIAVPSAVKGRRIEMVSSLSPDEVAGQPVSATVAVDAVEFSGLTPAARHYFHMLLDGKPAGVAAHRHVPLRGTPNFRDFGGYRTHQGEFVRWGQLYRSGMLSALSLEDMQALGELGIRLVCDFRRDDERQKEPSKWLPDATPHTEHLPLAPGNQAHTLKALLGGSHMPDIRSEDVVAAMEAINREFVVDHCGVYGRLLKLVLEAPGPLLIHCAAGKDRTGFGAAIILKALGVPEDAVMQDYLMTGQYLTLEKELRGLMRRYGITVPETVVEPIIQVRPQYLRAAFDLIDTEYGNFSTYLKEGLNFDESAQQALKAKLLQK